MLFGARMKIDVKFSFCLSNLTVCVICTQACNKGLSDNENSTFIIYVFSYNIISFSSAEVVCLALICLKKKKKNHILLNVNYPRADDQENRSFSSFTPLFSLTP